MAFGGYDKLDVLVVDDFDNFRVTVCKMLQELGVANVDTALHGNQAVKFCLGKHYDLILCDYNLGNGKNGQQVLEELRVGKHLNYTTLFVLISAETSRSIIMATYDYEPDAYLAKPITSKAMQQRLDRLLLQQHSLMPVYRALDDKNREKAISECQQLIESQSRYTIQCQKILGSLYLDTEAFDQAEQLYRSVLEVRMLDWAQVGLSLATQAKGDLLQAKTWLEEVIAKNPMCMQAYDALAQNCTLRGDNQELQVVLQQAVNTSPKSIVRQKELAETAVTNNDFAAAAMAYRRAVRLSQYSCHDSVETHLNYGRMTAALFKEDETVANELSRDALKVLTDIPQHFHLSIDHELQVDLLKCQVFVGQGNKNKAEELFSDIENSLNSSIGHNIDTDLDLVSALHYLGREPQAKNLLEKLIEKYQKDERALLKIDNLLEEPVSEKNRSKVSKMNRQGIALFEKKKYKEAIECFKQAKQMFPNHLGVHLNLIQAAISEMETNGKDEQLMDLSLIVLRKIENSIHQNHEQYKRFWHLKEKIRVFG